MAFLQYSAPETSKKGGRTVGRQYQSVVMMILLSLVMLGGIGSRLFYLQLVEGQRNRELAEENRVLLLPRRPARGTIFDRNGKILAGSRLSHSVSIWPVSMPKEDTERDAVVERLAQLLDIPAEEVFQRLEQVDQDSAESVPIARGISPAQATALAEYADQLPGVRVEAEAVRNYPHGDLAAHAIGYTREINAEELEARQDEGYRLGDFIGKMGAEDAFEHLLRGEWGGQQVEVDSTGRVVALLGEKPPKSGQDIELTLDLELQRAAEEALGDTIGAIIAIDPRDGAVRAMVSRPTFDPNLFTTRVTPEQWEQLNRRGDPFVNRTMRGYPPASTFKVVTTTAGIESGNYDAEAILPTYPYVSVGGHLFWDWNKAGFGPLGFRGAMAWSSDTFFYQVGIKMTEKPLTDWMRRYGFGSKTGIELAAEESRGLVPDNDWKMETLGYGWTVGDTVNISIGQGFMQVTPLQVAVMFGVPANGGYKVTPHLLQDGSEAKDWRTDMEMDPATIRVLQEGLRQVITGGTGAKLNDPSMPPLAGKSGTAETDPYENHTWFGAYGPYDDPEIIVVAFGEHTGGGGSAVALPMVQKVLDVYFNGPQAAEEAESGG